MAKKTVTFFANRDIFFSRIETMARFAANISNTSDDHDSIENVISLRSANLQPSRIVIIFVR